MAAPNPETMKLIEYLLRIQPESLELKSKGGHTPLSLALSLGRIEVAEFLISAGADQTVRDSDGANILHLILCSPYTSNCPDEKTLKKLLSLIDKRLVGSLLTERSAHSPGSLTPFSRWVKSGYKKEELLTILLDFGASTNNEHLELLDGSGETPLHYAVKNEQETLVKAILKYRPDLLHRENSVGRTPYEVAEDAYIASCVQDVPNISGGYNRPLIEEGLYTFAKGYTRDQRVDPKESMWNLCRQFAQEHPGKRRLVSLLDANEVAKRLANRHAGRQSRYNHDESDAESDDGSVEEGRDEVAEWYRQAPSNPVEKDEETEKVEE